MQFGVHCGQNGHDSKEGLGVHCDTTSGQNGGAEAANGPGWQVHTKAEVQGHSREGVQRVVVFPKLLTPEKESSSHGNPSPPILLWPAQH